MRVPEYSELKNPKFDLQVHDDHDYGNDSLTPKQIQIAGNVEGLIWLAKKILDVASGEIEGEHTHIDSETYKDIYKSSDGYEIIPEIS